MNEDVFITLKNSIRPTKEKIKFSIVKNNYDAFGNVPFRLFFIVVIPSCYTNVGEALYQIIREGGKGTNRKWIATPYYDKAEIIKTIPAGTSLKIGSIWY